MTREFGYALPTCRLRLRNHRAREKEEKAAAHKVRDGVARNGVRVERRLLPSVPARIIISSPKGPPRFMIIANRSFALPVVLAERARVTELS